LRENDDQKVKSILEVCVKFPFNKRK